jgi:hypothetical protein
VTLGRGAGQHEFGPHGRRNRHHELKVLRRGVRQPLPQAQLPGVEDEDEDEDGNQWARVKATPQ